MGAKCYSHMRDMKARYYDNDTQLRSCQQDFKPSCHSNGAAAPRKIHGNQDRLFWCHSRIRKAWVAMTTVQFNPVQFNPITPTETLELMIFIRPTVGHGGSY